MTRPGRRQIAMLTLAAFVLSGCAAAPTAPAPAPAAPPQQTLQVGDTTILAVSPAPAPCCKKPTLPECLGLPQLGGGIRGLLRRMWSRIQQGLGLEGRFPGLQAQAPLLPITDPANLSENSPPAVKAAAEVKKEEDSAAQKIQALRYLATIGCGGCYPGIEEAFISALEDCTEAVRYEAVVALRGNSCIHCRYCNLKACCSAKVQKKLQKIAYDTNDDGCFKEPSGRVRRLARQVLACCGGYAPEEEPQRPLEGPEAASRDTTQPPAREANPDGIRLVGYDLPVRLPAPEDALLARVNGEPIHQSAVDSLVDAELHRRKITDPRQRDAARRELVRQELDRVIDARLLRQQMQRERGTATPTVDDLQHWLRDRVFVDPHVSVAEVAEFYERHRDRFFTPATVRWEQIRVPLSRFRSPEHAQAVAEFLRARAVGGPSTGPDFQPGQVEIQTFGWTVETTVTHPLVARTLPMLPVGAVSPVLEGRGEFLIVRVLERRIGKQITLAAAASEIEQEIRSQRRARAEKAFAGQLRQSGDVWTVYGQTP